MEGGVFFALLLMLYWIEREEREIIVLIPGMGKGAESDRVST